MDKNGPYMDTQNAIIKVSINFIEHTHFPVISVLVSSVTSLAGSVWFTSCLQLCGDLLSGRCLVLLELVGS